METERQEETFVIKKGIFAEIIALGHKTSKAAVAFEKMLPLKLSRDEVQELRLAILAAADPEERRELLREADVCPCCERWMGNNRRPTDESDPPLYRRQGSFDF